MKFHPLTPAAGRTDSPVHRLPASLKLGFALILLIGNITVPLAWQAWFAAVLGLLGAVTLVSGISVGFLARRLLALSPLVLGVALVNALQPAGRGHWLGVAERSALCLLTVTLVANTTPLSAMIRVLQSVRVPGLLVTTITLMHRYLFVLAEEAGRMRRARASRSFTRARHFEWRTRSTVVGQLFIRASERAERVYDAMRARGWR